MNVIFCVIFVKNFIQLPYFSVIHFCNPSHIGLYHMTKTAIIFLIFAKKHRLWVLIRTASPRQFKWVPTTYILSRNGKISEFFFSPENFQLMEVKFSIYLNRSVFVMHTFLNILKLQFISALFGNLTPHHTCPKFILSLPAGLWGSAGCIFNWWSGPSCSKHC